MALGYVAALRNAQLDEISAAIGTSGKIRIYSGTRPATGGTETTIISTLNLSATSAPAASGGVLTFNAISDDTNATGGTATWFRVLTSANVAVLDGNVGTSGSDLNLNTTTIAAASTVSISSCVITAGNA